MDDDGAHADSPLTTEDEEIGAKAASDEEIYAVLSDYYRGEVNRANRAQDRIDQTTNWSITVLALFLSVVFSSPEMPAYLLLIGILALGLFLSVEVRRYRFYDLYRARTRFLEENFLANALEPVGVEHETWREELSDDLRYPSFKVTVLESLSRRLRRMYGALFSVVGIAWIAKVTLFTPETQWTDAAAVPGIHGAVVAGVLGVGYVGMMAIALLPDDREAKGEVYGEEPGDWKRE